MSTDLMNSASGVFGDRLFHELRTRETSRATRYPDFFTFHPVTPDIAGLGEVASPV